MNRRKLLTAGWTGALLTVSGCLDTFEVEKQTDGETAQAGDDGRSFEPRTFPDRPAELDSESVRAYVKTYEEVHHYNRDGNYRANCSPVIDHEVEEGMYASVICATYHSEHSVEDADGGWLSTPAVYLVTAEETVRIEPTTVEHDEPSLADGHSKYDASGLWLSNFDDQDHELSIQLVHHGSGDSIVLEKDIDLAARTGIQISRITSISGEYELYADLKRGDETNETLAFSGKDPFYAIHVTPNGTVNGRYISFNRP